jgi:hypothetical protein
MKWRRKQLINEISMKRNVAMAINANPSVEERPISKKWLKYPEILYQAGEALGHLWKYLKTEETQCLIWLKYFRKCEEKWRKRRK